MPWIVPCSVVFSHVCSVAFSYPDCAFLFCRSARGGSRDWHQRGKVSRCGEQPPLCVCQHAQYLDTLRALLTCCCSPRCGREHTPCGFCASRSSFCSSFSEVWSPYFALGWSPCPWCLHALVSRGRLRCRLRSCSLGSPRCLRCCSCMCALCS